jgi:hypothetical protein
MVTNGPPPFALQYGSKPDVLQITRLLGVPVVLPTAAVEVMPSSAVWGDIYSSVMVFRFLSSTLTSPSLRTIALMVHLFAVLNINMTSRLETVMHAFTLNINNQTPLSSQVRSK